MPTSQRCFGISRPEFKRCRSYCQRAHTKLDSKYITHIAHMRRDENTSHQSAIANPTKMQRSALYGKWQTRDTSERRFAWHFFRQSRSDEFFVVVVCTYNRFRLSGVLEFPPHISLYRQSTRFMFTEYAERFPSD